MFSRRAKFGVQQYNLTLRKHRENQKKKFLLKVEATDRAPLPKRDLGNYKFSPNKQVSSSVSGKNLTQMIHHKHQ